MHREHLAECSSTMDVARELINRADLHAEQSGLVTAEQQTAGRGRRGNTWVTPPPGAFLGTFWVRSELSAHQLSGLSLAVGAYIVGCINYLGRSAWLKWPNDIVAQDGGKVGGVLIEIATDSRGKQVVLIGIGVNWDVPKGVNATQPPSAFLRLPIRTSAAGPASVTAELLRETLAERFSPFWSRFVSKGISSFLDEWRNVAVQLGQPVQFMRGERQEQGTFLDVGEAGEALIEIAGRTERIFSGEIHTVRVVAPL